MIKKILQKICAKIRNDCDVKKLKCRGLIIGENYSVARDAQIDFSHCFLIEIGDNFTLTTGCVILAHDASTFRDLCRSKIARVKIGNNVFIGVNSVVLPGSIIGDNCIIGSGSVVCGKLESNSVYVGVPAKRICSKEQYIEKHKQMMLDERIFDSYYNKNSLFKFEQQKILREKIGDKVGYVK